MFVWPAERNLCNMTFDFDRNSVTHSLLPQHHLNVGSQSSSAPRLCGFLIWICLLFANSTANASERPQSGVYEVQESEIRVLVYRGGLFGIFGHNHVISTKDIDGRIVISEDKTASSVELAIPVESFEVDDQALRVEEGDDFKSAVSDKDKRGTKENMLGAELLNAVRFSSITIESNSWSGELPDIIVNATFTVRDQSSALEFPASVSVSEERIVVTGSFDLTHGQLGLEPFTTLLGGLRVRDDLEIKFHILATRADD